MCDECDVVEIVPKFRLKKRLLALITQNRCVPCRYVSDEGQVDFGGNNQNSKQTTEIPIASSFLALFLRHWPVSPLLSQAQIKALNSGNGILETIMKNKQERLISGSSNQDLLVNIMIVIELVTVGWIRPESDPQAPSSSLPEFVNLSEFVLFEYISPVTILA